MVLRHIYVAVGRQSRRSFEHPRGRRFLEPVDTAGLDTTDEAACRAIYEDVRGAVEGGMAALQVLDIHIPFVAGLGSCQPLEHGPRRSVVGKPAARQ